MLKRMISMARSAQEINEASNPSPINMPRYPWGLSLRFDQETLDKLDLDTSDVEVGDLLHMVCMAEVTSVSKHDSGDGAKCCVELTVTHIGLAENESIEYGAD